MNVQNAAAMAKTPTAYNVLCTFIHFTHCSASHMSTNESDSIPQAIYTDFAHSHNIKYLIDFLHTDFDLWDRFLHGFHAGILRAHVYIRRKWNFVLAIYTEPILRKISINIDISDICYNTLCVLSLSWANVYFSF